jgi:hypothetical protein
MTLADGAIEKVKIIDDQPDAAEWLKYEVEEAGFQPIIVSCPAPSLADLPSLIEPRTGFIFDHLLSPGNCANYVGAEAVALLYARKAPALLITTYSMDADVGIRRWRASIPVLLDRDAVDQDSLNAGFSKCLRELRDGPPSSRQTLPAIVRVERVSFETDEPVLDVIVSSWNPRKAVRLPLLMLPEHLRGSVQMGTRLIADVNVGAESGDELFFDNFRQAPEPNPNDGLA